MNWSAEDDNLKKEKTFSMDVSQLQPDEQTIVKILQDKKSPMMIDELSIKTMLPPSLLASLLLGLEFKNIVKSLPGKTFSLASLK
jgi:DNA processing protein